MVDGHLTPHLQACVTRLGTWIPFEHAAAFMADLLGVYLSEPTARRQTEQWGAEYEAAQEQEVARLEQELPPVPAGPAKLLLSVDGAMVPLVGGEWAEVKTMVLGVIQEPVWEGGQWVVHTGELSYFSRLMEAEVFAHAALGEVHRRGVEQAGQVVAVTDGAAWEQGFIDYHCEDAIRILDFPHAAEYVARMGEAVWGPGTPHMQAWLAEQLHTLKHQGATDSLPQLRALQRSHPQCADLNAALSYLEKREAQMQYPTYQAHGWPIGSGAVESANKVTVEARLKGAGMHWARAHVNPMLALRNAVCNDRWPEACTQIYSYQRQQRQRKRQVRRALHLAHRVTVEPKIVEHSCPPPPAPIRVVANAEPLALPQSSGLQATDLRLPRQPWRPGPDHPWRHMPIGKARYRQSSPHPPARK